MRHVARLTANFESNLDSIQSFLSEQQADRAFDAFLDRLFDEIIPNLERFTKIGRDFLAREPQSVEGTARLRALRSRIGEGEIREYLTGDYFVLYAIQGSNLYLLAIRHHRQLSFDLRSHWR